MDFIYADCIITVQTVSRKQVAQHTVFLLEALHIIGRWGQSQKMFLEIKLMEATVVALTATAPKRPTQKSRFVGQNWRKWKWIKEKKKNKDLFFLLVCNYTMMPGGGPRPSTTYFCLHRRGKNSRQSFMWTKTTFCLQRGMWCKVSKPSPGGDLMVPQYAFGLFAPSHIHVVFRDLIIRKNTLIDHMWTWLKSIFKKNPGELSAG